MNGILVALKGVGLASKTTWAMWIANGIGILVLLGVVSQSDADELKNGLVEIVALVFAVAPVIARVIKPILVRLRTGYWSMTAGLLIAVLMTGCVTATPGFGGKTRSETYLKTQQPDSVDEEGNIIARGESYEYKQNLELPAGVELTNQNNMSAGINAGGDWLITVGSDNTANTQGQAAMMTALGQAQFDAFTKGIEAVLAVAQTLGGMKIQGDQALDATRLQLNYQTREQGIALLQELLKNRAVMSDPAAQSAVLDAATADAP